MFIHIYIWCGHLGYAESAEDQSPGGSWAGALTDKWCPIYVATEYAAPVTDCPVDRARRR